MADTFYPDLVDSNEKGERFILTELRSYTTADDGLVAYAALVVGEKDVIFDRHAGTAIGIQGDGEYGLVTEMYVEASPKNELNITDLGTEIPPLSSCTHFGRLDTQPDVTFYRETVAAPTGYFDGLLNVIEGSVDTQGNAHDAQLRNGSILSNPEVQFVLPTGCIVLFKTTVSCTNTIGFDYYSSSTLLERRQVTTGSKK